MTSRPDRNFTPAIRCPYCGKPKHASISGWARTGLNVRHTVCPSCGQLFNVAVYVFASKQDEDVNDSRLSEMESSIKGCREIRRKREKELEEKLREERALVQGAQN